MPRHQCLIYEGAPASQLPGLAAVAQAKLKSKFRCLYVNSPAMVAGFRSYLAAGGFDVEHEVENEALVLSSSRAQLTNGSFHIDRMLQMLQQSLAGALQDGYRGLWATGDMLWEFGTEENLEKLLEYECKLEDLLREQPALSGVCQYHRSILPIEAVQVALYTHPAIYLSESLSISNPFFTEPAALRHQAAAARDAHVEDMLRELRRRSDRPAGADRGHPNFGPSR